jgi:hypothetical protein
MADTTYDPPRIEERVDITNPLIGNGSPQLESAVFRPL